MLHCSDHCKLMHRVLKMCCSSICKIVYWYDSVQKTFIKIEFLLKLNYDGKIVREMSWWYGNSIFEIFELSNVLKANWTSTLWSLSVCYFNCIHSIIFTSFIIWGNIYIHSFNAKRVVCMKNTFSPNWVFGTVYRGHEYLKCWFSNYLKI